MLRDRVTKLAALTDTTSPAISSLPKLRSRLGSGGALMSARQPIVICPNRAIEPDNDPVQSQAPKPGL